MSALCYGISSVTLKMISDRESPVTITAYQLLIGGAILVTRYGIRRKCNRIYMEIVIVAWIYGAVIYSCIQYMESAFKI